MGEFEDVELFYYFVESQGDPESDSLILWQSGGPGCTGFSGLVYEIGQVNNDNYKQLVLVIVVVQFLSTLD